MRAPPPPSSPSSLVVVEGDQLVGKSQIIRAILGFTFAVRARIFVGGVRGL